MKIAIIYVTEKGKKVSFELKSLLDLDSTVIRVDLYHGDVKNTVGEIFNSYDIIVGVMAIGILIRSIAPHIVSKTTDPGVICIDDRGEFVVSLLSGHIGRANEICEKIAYLISSQAVITTATDKLNKLGIDKLSAQFYWEILNPKNILTINKAVLNDEKIYLYSTFDISYIKDYILDFETDFTLEIDLLEGEFSNFLNENYDLGFDGSDFKGFILAISESELNKINNNTLNEDEDIFSNVLLMVEKNIVLGIGARKNISHEDVLMAIESACDDLLIDSSRINSFATASIKKDEKGILNAVEILDRPLQIVDLEDIKNFKCEDCSKSEFVKEKFDIDGVCEQSALIAAGLGSKLIYKKTAFDGVTIAIALSKE
ncbi:MAG: cobalamin biosynthesis protein [Methanobrevibacter sp.]|jgi:cobalt-precorrin 5A hydrolase|nr:cobalamin biosynthesis protein [Methanobrevibacter sp.]